MDEIELRPIGRKGLTSLRVISAVLILAAMVHLLVFVLVLYVATTGRMDPLPSAVLGAWCLAWSGVLAWGAGVAAEEMAEYGPALALDRAGSGWSLYAANQTSQEKSDEVSARSVPPPDETRA